MSITDAQLIEAGNADHERLATIDAQYGDGVPYDRRSVEIQARNHLTSSAMSMLEAGRCLLLLKEHEPHGAFMESLNTIGIEQRIANKIMQTTLKLEDRNWKTFSTLSVSKIYELALLDDDHLEALEQGGTVAGLTLDAMDKMTVRELKAALKQVKQEAQEDLDAKDAVIQQNNKTIAEQAKKLNRLSSIDTTPTPDEYEHVRSDTHALKEAVARLDMLTQALERKIGGDIDVAVVALVAEVVGSIDAQLVFINDLKRRLNNIRGIVQYVHTPSSIQMDIEDGV